MKVETTELLLIGGYVHRSRERAEELDRLCPSGSTGSLQTIGRSPTQPVKSHL
jgi:hypothetical protein